MPDQDKARPERDQHPTRILLVTGVSGAGRSTALKVLEDLGFEAMDNVPLNLLLSYLNTEATVESRHGAIAAGIDIRTRDFDVDHFMERIAPLLGRADLDTSLLFLDCDDEVLARRYTETRRRHPLAEDRPLLDGIRRERELMAPLRDRADLVIDTSTLSAADLKRLLGGHFSLDEGPSLTATVMSFSYRRGIPREADLVFDVRFLRNPHYEAALRPRTGLDADVARFIEEDEALGPFLERLGALLLDLLPRYAREGKTYLTIAIGCTGGQHRSVYVAKRLGERLAGVGRSIETRHRDVVQGPDKAE